MPHFRPFCPTKKQYMLRQTGGLTRRPGTGIVTKALFVAVDVHYLDDGAARAAVVAAHERGFSLIAWTRAAMVPAAAPYVPGEFYLRERDWGALDLLSFDERRERYGEDLDRRELDTFFWTPPFSLRCAISP